MKLLSVEEMRESLRAHHKAWRGNGSRRRRTDSLWVQYQILSGEMAKSALLSYVKQYIYSIVKPLWKKSFLPFNWKNQMQNLVSGSRSWKCQALIWNWRIEKDDGETLCSGSGISTPCYAVMNELVELLCGLLKFRPLIFQNYSTRDLRKKIRMLNLATSHSL